MKSTNRTLGRIFWAILILGGGVLLTLSAFGIGVESNPVKIIGSLLLLGVAVTSLVKLRFFFTFVPAAAILYLWRDAIGIPQIQLWPALGAGALLGIGLSLLVHRKHDWKPHIHVSRGDDDEDACCKDVSGSDKSTAETMDADETVDIDVRFGEQAKYIHSEHLKRLSLNVSFAEAKAFLDQCTVHPDGLAIQVNGSFCGIELTVPKTWTVENKVSTFAAAVNEVGRETPEGGVKVTITGNLSFGELKLLRV